MPSSVIAQIHYDEDAAILTVIFLSGAVYKYKKVPPEVYQTMKSAKSKGIYLNKHIKGNYMFDKIK